MKGARRSIIGASFLVVILQVVTTKDKCRWVNWRKKMVCDELGDRGSPLVKGLLQSNKEPKPHLRQSPQKSIGQQRSQHWQHGTQSTPGAVAKQPSQLLQQQKSTSEGALETLMRRAADRIQKTHTLWGPPVGPQGWTMPQGLSQSVQDATTHLGKGILASLLFKAPLDHEVSVKSLDGNATEKTMLRSLLRTGGRR